MSPWRGTQLLCDHRGCQTDQYTVRVALLRMIVVIKLPAVARITKFFLLSLLAPESQSINSLLTSGARFYNPRHTTSEAYPAYDSGM